MVSAEIAPWAKVGGLADVCDALARAMAVRGHDVRVVLPLYGHLDREREGIRPLKKLPPLSVRVGQRVHDVRVHVRGSTSAAVKVYLVESSQLYGRAGIYTDSRGVGFSDSLERASLHSQVALMLPRLLDWPVDIVHAHDAEAAPAILYRKQWYDGRQLPGPGGTLLTIHNLAHQEAHPADAASILGLSRSLAAYPGLLEFHGRLNLLKAGIVAADRVNTVSPTYALETVVDEKFGCGLSEILAGRGDEYVGILNGGDYETWNPARDSALPAGFDAADLGGKEICRRELLLELGLDVAADKPVCGFVGRLVEQKGIDLLLPLLDRLAGDGFAFAILGTGDKRLHRVVAAAASRHPDQIAFVQEFNESLAHRIYAGSDLFLMPSEFEPCGLSQMYALRYGTPPLVRSTGGLADTVTDVDEPQGNGFVFVESTPEALLAALRRAEDLFRDKGRWRQLQLSGMDCDFSWSVASGHYEKFYEAILAGDDGAVGR